MSNEAIVRSLFEVLNTRNIDLLDGVVDPDIVYHGMEVKGLGELKQKVGEMLAGFPDLTITIEDVVVEGDTVAVRQTDRGTHTGEFEGMPATGKWFEVPETNFFRIERGKIVEVWQLYDRLGWLQQLGLLPAEDSY